MRTVNVNGSVTNIYTDYNCLPFSVNYGNGATDHYAYNGLSQRVYYQDGNGISHKDNFDGAEPGALLLTDSQAVYTPGISEHRGSGSLFYANDALGSPRCMVNSSSAMTDDERFDAFGMTVYHGGQSPTTTPYGFVGKKGYQTDTSGLMLLGHRYYDAGIGRFLSRDPIHDGHNWYAYCGNNPLDRTDPTGLLAQLMSLSGFGQDLFAQSDDEDSDWSFYKYLYTGDAHASSSVYNAALEQGASGLSRWESNMATANTAAAGAVLSAGLGIALTSSNKKPEEIRPGARGKTSTLRRWTIDVRNSKSFGKSSKLYKMMDGDNRILKRGFKVGGMARAGALARFGILGAASFEAGAAIYSAARATQHQPLISATGE